LAADADTTTIVDWAASKPEPAMSPEPAAAAGESPEVIAAEGEAQLEPLIAAYLTEQSVQDPEMDALLAEVGPLAEAEVPEVTEDEMHAAAVGLRDALPRVLETRDGIEPAGIGDSWNWLRSTVADFVTPGDLEHMTPITQVAKLS
jgi:hypothetical protein